MATDIVLDVNIIHFMYKMLLNAASKVATESIAPSKRYYSVAPLGTSHRGAAQIIESYGIPPLLYHPQDITVVGGSALMIYDQQFAGFKKRRPTMFRTLREEIQRETRDVDLVWWPRLTSSRQASHIFTAESPSMIEFVENYLLKLREESQTFPMQAIPGMTTIAIDASLIRPAGVHMVHLDVMFGEMRVKLVEMAIHDNGSSQRVTEGGEPITGLLPMELDPMYCTSDPQKPLPTTTFRGTKPAIPHIYMLFRQQIFLYKNMGSMVPPQEEKRAAVLRRVHYLFKIVAAYCVEHTAENNTNMKRTFGIHTTKEDMIQLLQGMMKLMMIHGLFPQSIGKNTNLLSNEEVQVLENAVRANVTQLSNREQQEALNTLLDPSHYFSTLSLANIVQQDLAHLSTPQVINTLSQFIYPNSPLQQQPPRISAAYVHPQGQNNEKKEHNRNNKTEGGRRKTRKAYGKRRLAKSARRSRPSSR